MERQAPVQVDSDVSDVPPTLESWSAATGNRPPDSVVISRPSFPPGRRDGSRHCVAVGRTAGSGDWRSKRQAVPTARHLGAGKLSDQRYRSLRSRPRRLALPPQPVYLRKTHGASAQHGRIRCPGARCGLYSEAAYRYSASSPRNDERRAVGGGGPCPGRACDSRGRTESRAANRSYWHHPALAGSTASDGRSPGKVAWGNAETLRRESKRC